MTRVDNNTTVEDIFESATTGRWMVLLECGEKFLGAKPYWHVGQEVACRCGEVSCSALEQD